MEYIKKKNLLDNISNQPHKFRARNWVQIKFKTSIRSG